MLKVQAGRVRSHGDDDVRGKKIYGLLVCGTCSKLWTRDYKVGRNIARAARAELNKEQRPLCLCKRREIAHGTTWVDPQNMMTL